jgi:hypothetical protein
VKKFSTAEFKKAILAVEADRLKHPAAFRPSPAQRVALNKNRRASEKMLHGLLKKAGLDLEAFQALQQQRTRELERLVAKHKADAIKLASQRKDTLNSSIAAQTRAFRDLAAMSGFFPFPTFTLNDALEINAFPLIPLADYRGAPFSSFAKFRFSSSGSGDQKVGFFFFWENPSTGYALINAATFMSAVGHLKSHGDWTFGANGSWVDAYALFNVWFGYDWSNITSSTYASTLLGDSSALGTMLGSDTEGKAISSGVNLDTTFVAVPPGSFVAFEVALWLNYSNDSGTIDADFASGDFQITCPVVVFSVLSASPGMLA